MLARWRWVTHEPGGGAGALPEAAGEGARRHRSASREGIDGERLVEVQEGPLQDLGQFV
jgi:hypothetical protein